MTDQKKITRASATPKDPNQLRVVEIEGVTMSELLAPLVNSPEVRAASAIRRFAKPELGEIDLMALIGDLKTQSTKVNASDMSRVESILVNQAHTLDVMFSELARRAHIQMGERIEAMEVYLRMAFKAQNQSRATLQTLAELKFPRQATFVKQANIANGPQQVNNDVARPADQSSPAIEKQIEPNKQLVRKVTDGRENLDFGAAQSPGASDKKLAALEPINRAKKRTREGQSFT